MEHNSTNPVFVKDVDRNDIEAMRNFLNEHFRYWTMSSWNRLESYAHNVKLHRLGLTSEQLDRAFELLDPDIDTSAFWDGVHELISDFYEETGYMAGFNGRSGGYLVLYDTVRRNDTVSALSAGIDMYADFWDEDEWDADDLRARVDLVCRFDRLCEDIRTHLLLTLDIGHVESYEETVVVQQRRLMLG